jgi:hypothetical protein
MPLRQITYLGNVIRYQTPQTLANRLRITIVHARKLIRTQDRIKYIYNDGGDLKRFKLSDNPKFLQDFGIMRKQNSKIIQNARYKIKNNIIIDKLPSDISVKVKLEITIIFDHSDTKKQKRIISKIVKSTPRKLRGLIDKLIKKYIDDIDPTIEIDEKYWSITSVYSDQTFELKNNRLRDVKPLKLFYEDIDTTKYKDCVRDYLNKIYNKISKKTIDNLGNKNGVTTEELYDFCNKYKILMIAYDINGNVIKKHIPIKKTKSYKNLIYIAHNNHLYPLKNKYLHSIKPNADKIVLVEDADDKIQEFLKQNIEPINIHTMYKEDKDKFIRCFDVDKITYLENTDYNKCYNILKSFGIEDRITKYTTLMNIADLIMPLYNKNDGKTVNIDSFMPQCAHFTKGGYGYCKTDLESYENIKTIDKNKCYSSCLAQLPFLIQLDIRQSIITKYTKNKQPKKITDHYLYIVCVKKSSILLPTSNVYAGYHLKYARDQGIDFIIKEEITTNKKFNYFKPMIDDVYKKCNSDDCKWFMNVFIGKFEREEKINTQTIVDRLCNKKESYTLSGFKRNITGTKYYVVEKETETYKLFTRKPISIQIKDYSRVQLYEKIKELGIKEKDIVKIKTDSISFYDHDLIMKGLALDKSDIYGWKEEVFKPSADKIVIENNDMLTFDMVSTYKNQISEFYNCYAGTGKTYYIMNTLLPKFGKKASLYATDEDKYNYIVLTPSHSTIEDYRKQKYNCNVIQKYSSFGRCYVPEEKNIIIDEIGLCNREAMNVIHKCILAGKNIYSFGDFKQLLPVMEDMQFNNKTYLEAVYKTHKILKENMRNDFEIDYYDKIIDGKLNAVKEVKKHQTKNPFKSDVVICYRNKTLNVYNDAILRKMGFKDKFQKGVLLICKSNKLSKKGIYNNFILSIKDVKKNKFLLGQNSGSEPDLEFTRDEINEYFKPAYARTAYGVQGKSFLSYHYAKEDECFLKNNSRLAYTIISRLKTKFYSEPIKIKKVKKVKKVKKIKKDKSNNISFNHNNNKIELMII